MTLAVRQDSKYRGDDVWDWSVWLDGTAAELDAVDYAVYQLHKTFPDPVRTVRDRTTNFRLTTSGWGTFTIFIKVVMKDGSTKRLRHALELDYPEGAESPAPQRAAAAPPEARPRSETATPVPAPVPAAATSSITLRGYAPRELGRSALQSAAVRVKAELRPGAARGAGDAQASASVADRDVVELEFEGGLRLWLRGDEYRAQARRGASRSAAVAGEFEVPSVWTVADAPAERGLGGLVLKSLKILGIDPSGASAKAIAGAFEAGKPGDPKRPGPGFYRVRPLTGDFRLEAAPGAAVPTGRPVLVLIHGTASCTWGSFGDLWSLARRDTLAKIAARYGDNVFALEHRSFTQSVIANALDLAKALPSGARVDLLSHSRGGLVGELFCRANVADGSPPFDAGEIDLAGRLRDIEERTLGSAERTAVDRSLAEARAQLAELGDTLAAKGIRVGTFVRVACPALGTTLVSNRLDRWLSVVASAGSLALPGSPLSEVAGALGDFIAAVIDEKTDPSTLPGLAFFLPDAGLLRVVNNGARRVDSRLAVIAGDIEPSGIWQRLLTLVLDRFYDGEHDLVVNTESMYGGTPRTADNALVSFHSGPAVNHFNYFTNADSADAIARALAAPEAAVGVPGFGPLKPPRRAIPRGVVARDAAAKTPYVFVLPGIMGSELNVKDDRIWVSLPALATGGLERLAIGAADVRPVQPYPDYYADLVEFLSRTHRVIPFPFDWRLPPEEEGDRLAAELKRVLADAQRDGVAVSIVAHSMGGLIARAAGARHPDVWRDLKQRPDARIVMLGTPNGGSHAITELIVGQSETFRGLALLDLRHTGLQLLKIVTRFPGVLAMLPNHGSSDWFRAETWERFARATGSGWAVPDAADLARAKAFRDLLDANPVDPELTVYVAGCARATPEDMVFGVSDMGATTAELRGTKQGDGRVTWASGIPPDVPVWYMPAEHGDLSAATEHFPAVLDLLQFGATTKLPTEPPVQRGAEGPVPIVPATPMSLPDEAALAAAMLGAGRRRRKRPRTGDIFDVTLTHADLAYAEDPILVGHYAGDTIVSAEKALDATLGGRLSDRRRVGLYPGPLESSYVVIERRVAEDSWRGAVIAGLGPAGELTPNGLTRTVAQAVVAYALRRRERAAEDGWRPREGEALELGLSSLLIGTNAGGVRVTDSVLAIVEGVRRANQVLQSAEQPMRVARLQLVELWEDRVLQAVDALDLVGRTSGRGVFAFDGEVVKARGGRRRLRFDEPAGWWQRLQIRGGGIAGEADASLRFVTLTRRARAEARVVATQRLLVDDLIRRAIASTNPDPGLGATLFELLIPNAMKEEAPDREDMVLVVDEEAARYPWELLEDRIGEGRKPLAVDRGLVRQLESDVFRETVRGAAGDYALVVGDPILPEGGPFAPLPGAREEAELVANELRGGSFEADALIQSSAAEVISAFYAKPYRVLHLAGHGVYRFVPDQAKAPDKFVTGMVLGEGIFLTPAEVQQMRRVPEVVFVNCCHLGFVEARPGGTQGGASGPVTFNYFAANVATEFIRMGVRAVVAAGWAVDDAAAKTFAGTFYGLMLTGATFGDAVRAARERTWERHPYANTWGAYQCYGDPAYRLVVRGTDEAPASRSPELPKLATIDEAIQEIENAAAGVETGAGRSTGGFLARMAGIERVAEARGWASRARFAVAAARAYGEAGAFEQAIARYELAGADESAATTVRDMEQLSNYEARWALSRLRGDAKLGADERRDLDARIERAAQRLEWLMAAPSTGATAERLAILASTYKRLAWARAGAARRKALEASRDRYRQAYELAEARDRIDAWALVAWVADAVAISWQGRATGAAERKALQARFERARVDLEARIRKARNFWDSVCLVDLDLTAALLAGTLGAATVDALVARYLEARALGSPREFDSVREQVAFLADMAADAKGPGRGSANAKALRDLYDRLAPPAA